jgi:hypothetical protein
MDCLECGSETIAFAVPPAYREYLPGEEDGAALCTRCLTLQPVENPPAGTPSFGGVSDAIPDDEGAAIPLALMLGLLENLALNRSEISALLDDVERAGVDPLLVLDRLADDPAIDARADLRGRRRQLEQLL